MNKKQELLEGLAYCNGSEEMTRWSVLFPKHLLSQGAKYLCDKANCYWLVDAIASHTAKNQQEEFQVWTLTVKDNKAVLKGTDGNSKTLETQKISFTDFPLDEIKLYCILGSLDGVTPEWIIQLPSEY